MHAAGGRKAGWLADKRAPAEATTTAAATTTINAVTAATTTTIPTPTTETTKQWFRQVSSPRCVVCTAAEGAYKAHQSAYHCVTCGVHLCVNARGRGKKSCFERWHSVTCLKSLLKNACHTPGPKQKRGVSPTSHPQKSTRTLPRKSSRLRAKPQRARDTVGQGSKHRAPAQKKLTRRGAAKQGGSLVAVRATKKTAKKHPAVRVGTVNQAYEACAAAGQVGDDRDANC